MRLTRLVAGLLVPLAVWPRPAEVAPDVQAPNEAPPTATNEAVLDVAVDTANGPWCTAPAEVPAAAEGPGLSVEVWVRPTGAAAGTLVELSSAAGSLALIVDEARALRVEVDGQPRATGLSLPAERWTHIRLHATPSGVRLDTWSATEGERSFTSPAGWARPWRGFVLCAGGRRTGGAFAGWVDELRVWTGLVDGSVARRWRDRRVSDRHPLRARLLGAWPFSAGEGSTEAGLGPLGPMRAREGRWITLPTLVYGPLLRDARPHGVGVIFATRPRGGPRRPWRGAVESWATGNPEAATVSRETLATEDTEFVAQVTVEGLAAQTAYTYVPLVDGRRAIEGEQAWPGFRSPPPDTLDFDFATAFLADAHPHATAEVPPLPAYEAARRAGALFWAQLGDVMTGSVDGTPEERRTSEGLRALWERNFGTWAAPQARLAASVPLNLATISDHEIANNYSMNWHHEAYAGVPRESARLADRIAQYDVSLGSWWTHFGGKWAFGEPLGRAALADRGQSVMGRAYRHHGLYHSYRPAPFVEFFVLDTTSYRGDPYEVRRWHAREANRDTDHSRYPWAPGSGEVYIFGDRAHGATRQTDGVRSWLGPAQEAAFLTALRASTSRVVVVAAGYPLYSLKFEDSNVYWPGRESGFDFAPEAERLLEALVALNRLVLWVHGDGHSPALVHLRPNVYQLQTGATFLSGEGPGHHARSLTSGDRATGDILGGGELLAGHQPDLAPDDGVPDVFRGGVDQFEGFLRLYFHPGRELLRSSERHGLARGRGDREVAMVSATDPARGRAASIVVGKVARVVVRGRPFFSKVRGYRYDNGQAVFTLEDPVVSSPPEELRILVEDEPWVRADWYDAAGKPWGEFTAVLRRRSVV